MVSICIGEVATNMFVASIVVLSIALMSHFLWRNKIQDDSYKRWRLKFVYLLALFGFLTSLVSVLIGVDCA